MPTPKRASDKMLHVEPIRLSADESRLLLKALRAGKPVEIWGHQGNSLVDLGLLKVVRIADAAVQSDKDKGWKQIRAGIRAKDLGVVVRGADGVRSAMQRAGKRGIVLTPLGSKVASGLTVRMSRSV